MKRRIIRGVRIVTQEGMRAASVHVDNGVIVAVAGYDELPRTAIPEELGKGVLMPGIVQLSSAQNTEDGGKTASAGGITTLVQASPVSGPSLVNRVTAPISDIQACDDLRALLPRTWTGMRNRGESVESIVDTLCAAPAKAAGIETQTGQIAVGMRADFAVWHPEYSLVWEGELLYGLLRQTIVQGTTVYKDGTFPTLEVVSS